MVEVIELLCQLERIFGRVSRFRCWRCTAQPCWKVVRREATAPTIRRLLSGTSNRFCRPEFLPRISPALRKIFVDADDRVLCIGPGLAFKAQGFFEVKGDDRIFGELQHEVPQCANGDLRCNFMPFILRSSQDGGNLLPFVRQRSANPGDRRPLRRNPCAQRLLYRSASGLLPILHSPVPWRSAA